MTFKRPFGAVFNGANSLGRKVVTASTRATVSLISVVSSVFKDIVGLSVMPLHEAAKGERAWCLHGPFRCVGVKGEAQLTTLRL